MKPVEQEGSPQLKYRKDYAPPSYLVERIELRFEIGVESTLVEASSQICRAAHASSETPLVLDGENLELLTVEVDGQRLESDAFVQDRESLTIAKVPDRFVLETKVLIYPKTNKELSGLYQSGGMYCSQCEAEGFRRITFHLDRPDVMSLYSTTIVADPKSCSVLLSNGNLVDSGELDDGRKWVRWDDPYKKPSYLFALVAGNLVCQSDMFTTRSGREVRLEVWVEPENIDKCAHALTSLKRAMKWDEETFGLEYDLDIYMIVAVRDFNMGAMENKGLNIFNSKYVLAKRETATDQDYEDIEGVIGHEYFHNWTGNRVTCRDWFQLTLKEGLTVFRDQLFTAAMHSAAVKRIADVRLLRTVQFEEDAGPMTHPIRPEAYIAMDNFYTSTVYIKGAEVVRMYFTLLGETGFRKGMDLYFERHDGQAVTCDDFLATMADANARDLSKLAVWYGQPGTPTVSVEQEYSPDKQQYKLTFTQSREDIPGYGAYEPCLIPCRLALLGSNGRCLPLKMAKDSDVPTERILEIKDKQESFVFENIDEKPIVSLFRDFSAPVKCSVSRTQEELAFLFGHDSDLFGRWDAGQTLASQIIVDLTHDLSATPDPRFIEAYGRMLEDPQLDPAIRSLAMVLPALRQLAQLVQPVDPSVVFAAREKLLLTIAQAHEARLVDIWEQHASPTMADRKVRHVALSLLCELGDSHHAKAWHLFQGAKNMTDSKAALSCLVNIRAYDAEKALSIFYDQWKADPLVLDKWFAIQATSKAEGTYERVVKLREHHQFDLSNPNRVRSLVGTFAMNMPHFHRLDGLGYQFLGDQIAALHSANPQLAARLVVVLNGWRRYEVRRAQLMKAQLERLAGLENLAKDVFEVIQRSLHQAEEKEEGKE